MHATIRTYSDPEMADLLASNKDEVEEVIRAVPGVRSYTLMRTEDGAASITVGENETATQASRAAAAEFLRRKAPNAAPPAVIEGSVIIQLDAGVRA